MAEGPKQLRTKDGTPVTVTCPKCGNTDPFLFGFLEDEPILREAKRISDQGVLVFESLIAKHYYEASTNSRLECQNEVLNPTTGIRHTCMEEVPIPEGVEYDFE